MDEKLIFARRVAEETRGLVSVIAKIAVREDRLEELMAVFEERFCIDRESLHKALGTPLYNQFLVIRNS